jgi:hypothetical protein
MGTTGLNGSNETRNRHKYTQHDNLTSLTLSFSRKMNEPEKNYGPIFTIGDQFIR